MVQKLDCVVVGAGVVGLAVARSLAFVRREVVVLEAESRIGMHASSRNSEVLHAGIYYPEGSLKARLCVTGREMLYRYCEEHRIACKRLGKIIVATSETDLQKLRAIDENARKNGVTDLRWLDSAEVAELEPNVVCRAALLSPSTGIVDSHELMLALQADLEAKHGVVVCNSRVTKVAIEDGGFRLTIAGVESEAITCKTLINSAGLWAQDLAASIHGQRHDKKLLRNEIPQLYFAKAHYYAYQGKSPFEHLIYPLPSGDGLGIHATNDLAGAARFGPDATWINAIDYAFDESTRERFLAAIREYFPDLDSGKLVPAYTGIRPKLCGPGAAPADFVIQGEEVHGVPGLVHLFGIDSPGLTASLAIGEHVQRREQAPED